MAAFLGRRAKFIKGAVPDWLDQRGTLVRATATFVKANNASQVPGYQTVRPLVSEPSSTMYDIVARLGDFGLYLGKKHVRHKLGRGRGDLVTPVPTFWFNGRRLVFTTIASYDDAVVSDDAYDDWKSSILTNGEDFG